MDRAWPRALRNVAPWGFLGMLALVISIDRLEFQRKITYRHDHELSWEFTGRMSANKFGRCQMLCFGDSLVKMDISPRVLRHYTGRMAYNLALYNGPAPATYFLFRRALAAGARPKAVLVDFASGILNHGPRSKVRQYPWSSLLSLRETAELAWTSRDADLFVRTLVNRFLPSARYRFGIRSAIVLSLAGDPNRILEITTRNKLDALTTWGRHRGMQLNRHDFPAREMAIPPRDAPLLDPWHLDAINDQYATRFLALAAERGIKVYWLLPPLQRGWHAMMEYSGENERVANYIRRLQSRFPGVVVVDGSSSGYEAGDFIDLAHLNGVGAVAFTEGVAEVIRESTGVATTQRWFQVPPLTPERRASIVAMLERGDVIPSLPSSETIARTPTPPAPPTRVR